MPGGNWSVDCDRKRVEFGDESVATGDKDGKTCARCK